MYQQNMDNNNNIKNASEFFTDNVIMKAFRLATVPNIVRNNTLKEYFVECFWILISLG